jgi:hypothetical protein
VTQWSNKKERVGIPWGPENAQLPGWDRKPSRPASTLSMVLCIGGYLLVMALLAFLLRTYG